METVELSSIDFKTLTLLQNIISTESNIYHDNNYLYKMYTKSLKRESLNKKEKRLEALNGRGNLPNVIIPSKKIVDETFLMTGCISDYKKDTSQLYNFLGMGLSYDAYLRIIKAISDTLKVIHDNEIIVTDLNFGNIIFNKETMEYFFVDFDSCTIDGITGENFPLILNNFLRSKGIVPKIDDISKNMDRLSLMLSFLWVFFNTSIQFLPIRIYDSVAERVKVLKDIRQLVLDLVSRPKIILEIPYIGDCIHIDSKAELIK